MGIEAKAGFVGLVTATGEAMADKGALRIADNVTLRKEGALALRSLFGSTALPRAYRAAIPYRGQLWYIAASNVVYTPAGAAAALTYVSGAIYPGEVRADIQSAVESRGNLYFASSAGMAKVSTASDTAMRRAGARASESAFGQVTMNSAGPTFILTNGQQVAYRVVTVLTDVNGVVVRSRPTGALTLSVTVAGNYNPSVAVYYKGYAASSNIVSRAIEVYRTRVFPNTAQTDDEMQLVATSTPPVTSQGVYQIIDAVPDTSRGATLYTSPSRGGTEAANDMPPGAACVERFRRSLFFGNIVGPHRITVSYLAANVTGSATGVGMRTATGTNTAGGTTITAVSNTTGLQVGMVVYTQTSGKVGSITAIAGTTITVSAPILAAQTAQPVVFYDAITVDGVTYELGGVPLNNPGLLLNNTSSVIAQSVTGFDAYNVYEVTPAAAGYNQTLVIERTERGGSPIQIKATHGNEMSPALPLASGATTTASTNDVLPHALYWSEPDEPEHVPPKNFARVGDAGKAILALIATKDRLLIFKEDGLFMLTGDTARNFAIYPLDTTCLCILPGSVRRLQNTVYALTNLGLIAVDDGGGVTVVSRAIQTELAPIVTQIRQAQASSGLYTMPGLTGVTGTSDDPNGEYWLLLGSTTPSFGGQALIWNAFRQGFTTYSFGTPAPVCVAQDGSGQPLVLTASTLLTPSTALGAIVARISPRAFVDPALVGHVFTSVVAAFSQLTGTASVQARFSSSESMVAGTSINEDFDISARDGSSLIQHPAGSLLRHPLPRAMARAFLSFVELVVNVTSGTFTLDAVGMETRENIPNKKPSHGSGAT